MQTQAQELAKSNVGNWQPTMNMATGDLSQVTNYNPTAAGTAALTAAANPAYNTVQNYMNPYVNNVVSQIGDLAEQNIMNNVAPQTSAGLVGSGQFGSQRGAQALANTLGQYGQQTTAQQVGALNTGYNNAMNQAQTGATLQANIGQIQGNQASMEQQNLTNAAQTGGVLAGETQKYGANDVDMLDRLGAEQRAIDQGQQMFPFQVGQAQAGLLQGANIPASVNNTYTGPMPGAYQSAPLSQIAGIGSLLGSTQGQNLISNISGLFGNTYSNPSQATLNAANASSDPLGSLIAAQTGQIGG
jgi:hypothetical protein